MVSDITDHAALEQGTLTLHESAFSLRAALSQCLDLYRPAAASKGLRLELDVPASVPDHLYGDAFRLRPFQLGDRAVHAFGVHARPCADHERHMPGLAGQASHEGTRLP